jgi:glyoxylase-like metal-dependent hydrolase (beta-lactamase superfamily II)
MMNLRIEGITALLERVAAKVHVQEAEVPWVVRTTGVAQSELAAHDPGDRVRVGEVEIELVHTPGHTPGSQCFLVEGRLVSGDTLFLDGCGRTDLPGSDVDQMYDSLQRLSRLPDDTLIYPGHRYSLASSAMLASVKESNIVFKPPTREGWLRMFGAS